MKKEPKSIKISARITAAADEKLNKNAKTAKLSKSRYLEQLILGKEVTIIGGLDAFVPALKSSGKNLHQILVRLNTGQIFSPDVREVQQTYGEIFLKLNELAQGCSNGSD